ncbi:helix-turn-helix transcriptional regulator [Microbacterium sp. Sa4CUA7]|uniref:Helix-turn-helix transcriptional regulator n=1 Tax=Microbacterium pullorum TaxID=2762236 RepID=A0ABR8S3W6_9MICO|nr:helix-turn-helix transcriptional regulator [Microbacterium pullorum]MBD7958177.1 helix-turn-helix transcriptional regulator [Microbacterium pullorum]
MTVWHRVRTPLRAAQVAHRVAECARDRRGVLVVGAPGDGASRLAADIATQLRIGGHAVMRLDDADRSAPGSRPTAPTDTIVVASARVGVPLPAGIAEFLAEHTDVVPLAALTRVEAAEVVTAATGHPPTARLVEALWRSSHGNLAALRATYDELERRGLINLSRGQLHMTLPVRDALDGLETDPARWVPQAESAPLRTVALEPLVTLDDLAELHDPDAVRALVRRGLLRADGAGERPLVVHPPLLAEVLRREATAGQRDDDYRAIARLPGAVGRLPAFAAWALAQGWEVTDADVVCAVRAASAVHDYAAGVRVADIALTGPPASAAPRAHLLLVRAQCLRLLERLGEAESSLTEASALIATSAGGSAEDRERDAMIALEIVAARADLAHYRERSPDGALALFDEARTRWQGDHDLPRRITLDALTILHLSYAGRFPDAVAAYRALVHAPPGPLGRRLEAFHAIALDALGRSDEAMVVLGRLDRQAESAPHSDWVVEEHLAARFTIVLHGEGVVALARETAWFQAVDANRLVLIAPGMRRLADAEVSLSVGDVPAAVAAAHDALKSLERDGPEDYLPRAVSLYAHALALGSDAEGARAQLTRLASLPGATNSPTGPEVRSTVAGTLAALGEHDEALARCRALAAEGLVGAAMRGAMTGVIRRHGPTCAFASTLTVSGAVPLLTRSLAAAVLSAHARDALLVSRTAAAAGQYAIAYAAATLARDRLTPGSSLHAAAVRLVSAAAVHARGLDTEVAAVTPLLTRRERQVADLMSQGLGNAEIAETLQLSKRTVEGHINRIYGKTALRDGPRAG